MKMYYAYQGFVANTRTQRAYPEGLLIIAECIHDNQGRHDLYHDPPTRFNLSDSWLSLHVAGSVHTR